MAGDGPESDESGADPHFLDGVTDFPDALRLAIEHRGLSLDRIQARLSAAGASVSTATLSYWQSGRTRPERVTSLVALSHLERILELPAGVLARRLGPPRPRGHWHPGSAEYHPYALWSDPESIAAVRSQINTQWDGRLSRISVHDRIYLGPDRTERLVRSRLVLRAEVDGPDRWAATYMGPEHCAPPTLHAVPPSRLGRRVVLPDTEILAAEILFDHALAKNETTICEFGVTNPRPGVSTFYEGKFRLPVREYLLEVSFTPPAIPAVVEQYEASTLTAAETTRPLTVDSAQHVHALCLGFGPGRFGIRWQW